MQRDPNDQPVTAADVAADVIDTDPAELRTVAAELPPFERWNVLVAFEDNAEARRVVQSLERAGIDGSHLSYLALEAADDTAPQDDAPDGLLDDDHRRDADGRTARSVGAGAAIGGGAGAIGGALTGMALLLVPGVGTLAGIGLLGVAIGGAAAGGNLGLVWGGYRRLGAAAAWEHTFAEVESGRSIVGVHTDDDDVLRRALEVLPREGRRAFDSDGEPVELTDR